MVVLSVQRLAALALQPHLFSSLTCFPKSPEYPGVLQGQGLSLEAKALSGVAAACSALLTTVTEALARTGEQCCTSVLE